ncbi:MAG: hypothetical protein IPJ03_16680 [Ignavibacteriales bacterium]|nr:hypothetical protein [Ignavibacteriales bacterium]MBK7380593.1 hypothetical protein [Ignavibacteriales bacterium]
MKPSEIIITVKMGEILDSDNWEDYCYRYGINEWCINEGRADRDTEVQISLADAMEWGLIKDENL